MAKQSLFILSLCLAACGGRGPAPSGAPPSGSTDTAATAPPPAAAPDSGAAPSQPAAADSARGALADVRFGAARDFANTYCADCHSRGGAHMAKPKALRKLPMDTYEEWVAGAQAIPGRLNLDSLKGKPMPPQRFERQPSTEERRLILDWIGRGSPNTVDGR